MICILRDKKKLCKKVRRCIFGCPGQSSVGVHPRGFQVMRSIFPEPIQIRFVNKSSSREWKKLYLKVEVLLGDRVSRQSGCNFGVHPRGFQIISLGADTSSEHGK